MHGIAVAVAAVMRSTPAAAFLHDLELLLAGFGPRVERLGARALRSVAAVAWVALAITRL